MNDYTNYTIKYKLTDKYMRTYGGCQWVLSERQTTDGAGELCGPGWLHYYHHPLLAVLLNPIHGNIWQPRLFECEATGQHLDNHGLKAGCTQMTLIRELPVPEITVEQRVTFAILCALEIHKDSAFVKWANAWIDGSDRSEQSSRAAAWEAEAAAWAAEAAVLAAWEAAWEAGRAAGRAAEAAVLAADRDGETINLVTLALRACQ